MDVQTLNEFFASPLGWVTTLILLALGGLAAAALFRSHRRRGSLAHLVQSFDERNRELSVRLAQLTDDSRRAQAELSRTLNDRLDKVSERMGRTLSETAVKTAKSMGEIETRLKVIDEAQKSLASISGEIVGLQDLLANKQARGAFGEVQLNDIITSILPPDAYSLQTTLSNQRRVDCLIKLPDPPGPIAVDAKFPLESYATLRNAENDADRTKAARTFAQDIRKHVGDIAGRYIIPGETADSALMFLPSEAVYAELHANFQGVVEDSYRSRVWIVSPTTLMATLNTIRAVLKDVRMREQAGLIQKEVGLLKKDVDRLDKRVGNLTRHMASAEGDLGQIQTSTGKIARRAERITKVELEEPDESPEALSEAPGPRLVIDKGD